MSPDRREEPRASPHDELARAQAALDAEKEKNVRLLADFDNYRRRVAREQSSMGDEGRREVLRAMLPVFDTLERALEVGSIDGEFFDGVAATGRMFLEALNAAGAEPVPSVGQPFDPRVHEVVEALPHDTAEEGTVVRELRRGFRLGDELLRPAQVGVARSPEAAGPWR